MQSNVLYADQLRQAVSQALREKIPKNIASCQAGSVWLFKPAIAYPHNCTAGFLDTSLPIAVESKKAKSQPEYLLLGKLCSIYSTETTVLTSQVHASKLEMEGGLR